ncbi:MAG: hypothetical protein MJE77_16610 [Proteobacteria bacterium]|nr:hypothetical protein [Pseudomonadota bacterium]
MGQAKTNREPEQGIPERRDNAATTKTSRGGTVSDSLPNGAGEFDRPAERKLDRRQFLAAASSALAAPIVTSACSSPATTRTNALPQASWRQVRLVGGSRAGVVERTCLQDAAGLLSLAVSRQISVIDESEAWGPADILVGSPASSRSVRPEWRCAGQKPGAFRIVTAKAGDAPRVAIIGTDAEGARNGLYRFLERIGFGFFRDGDRVPELADRPFAIADIDDEVVPAFRWRGEMIWDHYLGPQRYCAATWGPADWERALVHAARSGLNLIEFYPPMKGVFRRVFPAAAGATEGPVWTAEAKEELSRQVLERGRALGIHFMYVLAYGPFPDSIRALYPDLEWRNGFLCAHQPQLRHMTERTWADLLAALGTDHLYAVRHRGEEGQSYSDPCRSVSKAQGTTQAIEILRALDAEAVVTVWTWSETLPDFFAALPENVRAAHIRHGMGGVFKDRGKGREQSDGRPALPPGQHWLAGQFTVFGGNETLLQTPWSDPDAIANDARAASRDARCEGFFQWPEWTATSPWLSYAIAQLAWTPHSFHRDAALKAYARSRHGPLARAFLAGFDPLVRAGNARFTSTPRKRMIVPYLLIRAELDLLRAVRRGAEAMWKHAGKRTDQVLFVRDLVDLVRWLAVRQAHVFEAVAYIDFLAGDRAAMRRGIASARATWSALRDVLAEIDEFSVAHAARAMANMAPLSGRALDSFWLMGCNFYRGYPLVLSPEAIELVYAEQTRLLGDTLEQALDRGDRAPLAEPGWFWHDWPDPAWAGAVRLLPREDGHKFETIMRRRLAGALEEGARERKNSAAVDIRRPLRASLPSPIAASVLDRTMTGLLAHSLPSPIARPPR